MQRRQFFKVALTTVALGFFSPKILFARQRRVSDFLRGFAPVYNQNHDWDFGQGSLLIGINGQSGHFHVYVDDQRIVRAVDQTAFDHDRQRLQIRRTSGEVVFSYDPRLRAAPIPLR
ncbi:hypothetical protein H6761_00440 [Candidatus Nomurabacteria bacterium]|nr:hypothetical protein [Candidatus Nomurabacteria bacterium]